MRPHGTIGQFVSLCVLTLLLVQQVPIPVHQGGPCPVEQCDCETGICRCDHWMGREGDRRAAEADGPVLYPCEHDARTGAIVFSVDRTLPASGPRLTVDIDRSDPESSLTSLREKPLAFRLLRPPRG